jgi:hypothetical protein
MAFEFITAMQGRLFFPTVHIHDGTIQKKADFDHVLYSQAAAPFSGDLTGWTESTQPAGMFMNTNQTVGLIEFRGHVYRSVSQGTKRNQDTIV